MAHGAPDDSNLVGLERTFSFGDLSELAVRTGSPVVYERSGNVLYYETWDTGLSGWLGAAIGTGSYLELSNEYTLHHGISLELHAGTAEGRLARVERLTPIRKTMYYGLSVGFCAYSPSVYIQLRSTLYGPTQSVGLEIRIDPHEKTLEYLKGYNDWEEFATDVPVINLGDLWNYAKLIVNGETDEYVRFSINGVSYDLTGKTGVISVSSTAPLIYHKVSCVAQNVGGGSVWVDSLVLTENEP